MLWFFGWETREILVPQSGIEPTPPALEGEVSTTGSFTMALLFTACCIELPGATSLRSHSQGGGSRHKLQYSHTQSVALFPATKRENPGNHRRGESPGRMGDRRGGHCSAVLRQVPGYASQLSFLQPQLPGLKLTEPSTDHSVLK